MWDLRLRVFSALGFGLFGDSKTCVGVTEIQHSEISVRGLFGTPTPKKGPWNGCTAIIGSSLHGSLGRPVG